MRLPLHEAQIIQETLNRVRVRYVPAEGFDRKAEYSMIAQLQMRMGPVEVVLEPVDEVPRAANGKFRAVVCNLTSGERELIDRKHPSII